ncbi:hypothetical protein CWI38_2366p0010, partial [Hamiltosporidium tvaerminnensis]
CRDNSLCDNLGRCCDKIRQDVFRRSLIPMNIEGCIQWIQAMGLIKGAEIHKQPKTSFTYVSIEEDLEETTIIMIEEIVQMAEKNI